MVWERLIGNRGKKPSETGGGAKGNKVPSEARLGICEQAGIPKPPQREVEPDWQTLLKKEAQLRHSQKLEAVGALAGGIAHEFNNLLQAISGYTNYAMEGLSPAEQRYQDLQQVLKAANRATTLTRSLLTFGRRQVLERRNIDLNQLITDLAKMIRPLIGEHIELEVALVPGTAIAYIDPGAIQQVLLNLCVNSRDAMPSGGKLIINTAKPVLKQAFWDFRPRAKLRRYVVLQVTDNGCGMSPEVKGHLFEPFYTTKEVGEGTGLGLATVYGIVQQHEGTIDVASEPGKGTTVKICLPATDATAHTDGTPGAMSSVPGGTETILVAEDESMVRELAVRILKNAGYTVLAASDGEEALRTFQEHSDVISLVLLDAVMPKVSGQDVCRQIKAQNPGMRIVFCSGYDRETSGSSLIRQENLPLVDKPYDPDALLRAVREVLDAEQACPLTIARV
jgi:two-component system cell cycle sensor histidine kinase/response regulator CckA